MIRAFALPQEAILLTPPFPSKRKIEAQEDPYGAFPRPWHLESNATPHREVISVHTKTREGVNKLSKSEGRFPQIHQALIGNYPGRRYYRTE
jgi:hypothetical protein